jgi:predicted nucleic acid-binding Zn ribbon protein
MHHCPVCNSTIAVQGGPCAACSDTGMTSTMRKYERPVKNGRGVLFWMVIFVFVVLLGIVLFPYIVWTLAGPMPSLG